MLYERWLQVVREFRREVALVDLAGQCRWSFERLAATAEADRRSDRTAFAQGAGSEFVLSVLRAWRAGAVLCPLEPGQAPPDVSPHVHNWPAGAVHLKTTSATTGAPRFVAFTARQLAADVDQIVATMGLRPEWPNVAAISLAHSYGFSNLVLPLLLHGIPLVQAQSPLPESIRAACNVFPAVTLAAVPALWRTWADAEALGDNIQLAISAGAPLPLPLEQEVFARHELKIHNFYGATECGGIAYDRTAMPRTDSACVGRPMQGVTLSLDQDGCLCVTSPAVGLTAWPEPTPHIQPGSFQTSDLAELIGGCVYLRGRQSDLINVAGRKVSPETIERILGAHPQVRDCLVFGAPSPDGNRAEMVVACVAPRAELSPDELKQYLQSRLPAWQVPRAWWLVADLPANRRGKIARRTWRQKYLEMSKSGSAPWSSAGPAGLSWVVGPVE